MSQPRAAHPNFLSELTRISWPDLPYSVVTHIRAGLLDFSSFDSKPGRKFLLINLSGDKGGNTMDCSFASAPSFQKYSSLTIFSFITSRKKRKITENCKWDQNGGRVFAQHHDPMLSLPITVESPESSMISSIFSPLIPPLAFHSSAAKIAAFICR